MLKRLIEVALPFKEVPEQSAREEAIRHGHVSTLHLWWAREIMRYMMGDRDWKNAAKAP